MMDLETMLQTYFQCEGDAFDRETGELTKNGLQAYNKLNALIINLADLLGLGNRFPVTEIIDELDNICDMPM